MKKTRNLIVGGVVAIGVLAAVGAITIARYAAKHMDHDIPDDCECDGDCEHCPMNDPDVEVEIEVQPEAPAVEVPVEEVVVQEEPAETVETVEAPVEE